MICTDGQANAGVGTISRGDTEFYRTIGFRAKEKGVSVSVLTLEGEDCSMENLGKTADITNGSVEIVNPVDLQSKVLNIFSNQVLATKAHCTVIVPHVLSLRAEDKDGHYKASRELASISSDSDLTFSFDWNDDHRQLISEYILKKYDDNRPATPAYFEGVPIQVQVLFNNLAGDQLLHTLTLSRPTTTSRNDAEDGLNSTAVALQAIHESARLAQFGKYDDARINLVSVQRLLQRTMKEVKQQKDYLSYVVQAEKLDQFMREAKAQEGLGVRKDANSRDDEASKAMYQMKSVSTATFNNRK